MDAERKNPLLGLLIILVVCSVFWGTLGWALS